jgi:hypothetical protein
MAKIKSDSAEAMLKALKNPFDARFVKWRVGATTKDKTKGIALAYIDAREVKKRLDDVCGIDGWEDELIACDDGFICNIRVRLPNGEWVKRSGAAGNTKVSAIKGGASDAFKRAASKLGVGHYLYYLPNTWAELKPQGESYVLAESPALPKWAQPGQVENWEDVAEMEAEITSGEDVVDVDLLVDGLDKIRAVSSMEELEIVYEALSPNEKVSLVNQVAMKRKELDHESRINSDNS